MKWNSFLADQRLDGPPSFWRVSKCLVGKTHNVIPPLKSAVTGNFAVTDQEKVELLAETYEAQMKCLPPAQNTKTKDIDTVINESNSVKRPVTPAFLLNHCLPATLVTPCRTLGGLDSVGIFGFLGAGRQLLPVKFAV
ncbi:uncharacterized protein LOC143203183 [Rhynchophorus ferrugineus]|uniref:uncharacterized protein LOC143203183 n=1 Tax=Rhynchophorus ferrugineus TaxID=354439 RepID=UPI003FCEC5C7